MKKAAFWERVDSSQVCCGLCRFRCLIGDGARGICGVRENRGGTLYSLVYGTLCSAQIDPIEKKPLFHVMPGSSTYSIATVGCNFHCRHCQNFSISQLGQDSPVRGTEVVPDQVVRQAVEYGCRSISHTYTEPTINFEFACDTARLAREAGLLNVFVTNGYISKEALKEISPYLDAANIDLKGFSDSFYRNLVQAKLSEVLDSILEYRKLGIWIELTTLVIPGLNDSDEELTGIASFITTNLGIDTPWHVSMFHPTYKLTSRPSTPLATLQRARNIGLAAGLRYVYEGNVPGRGGENTVCPTCAALLIERHGFKIVSNRVKAGACPECEAVIAGIGL
ncbi:MAG: AmmeMemoRadiSam system radical SAM enzyme [Desulfuromonadaceae bacterium]|nr:AmmeMemoRadiSam system radical SAM enzyme [Desulfuromonadaceae bacterium]MDD5104880.1 AmmeMemoRadiSam system radical SAM enzyme [Desulfuromonadaceae bacterium]